MAKTKFILLAPAFLMTACATQLTWQRRAGLDHFVGRSQGELVSALGPPDRSWVAGGMAYTAYGARGDGPSVAQNGCTTTFRIAARRVQAWSVQGNSCFVADSPRVAQFAENYAGQWGAGHTTGFVTNRRVQEQPAPGRSVVQYGVFYSQ